MDSQEFILRTSKIFTMDQRNEVLAGDVVVRSGRIVAVLPAHHGATFDLPVIDLGDRPVLPAFVDPHIHLEMSALALWGTVDCHVPPVHSIDDLIAQLREHRDLRELHGGWLVGQGGLFSDRRFAERRFPNKDDLDKVSKEFPIAVRLGGHITVLNSAGLEAAFENGLPDTGDSYIHRDDSGVPNGIVQELYYALPIPELSVEQKKAAIVEIGRRELVERGVSVIGEITDSVEGIGLMAEGVESGDLPLWVRAFVWAPGTMRLAEVLDPAARSKLPPSAAGRFDVRGLKIFVDGGISAQGAALLKPYRALRDGKQNFGRMAYSRSELMEIVRRADDEDLQVAAHVNGEYAQRLLCQATIDARGRERAGRYPVRLEHAGNMLTEVETLDYWRRADAIPIPQASGIWHSAPFVPDYAGDYMRSCLRMLRLMQDHGWDVSSSSDASGSENLVYNPLFGVQEAVTRAACTGVTLLPEQSVSVMEALRMHTAAAARDLGVASEVGSIEMGKRADLIALDCDPRECEPTRISSIEVERVYIAGRLVKG